MYGPESPRKEADEEKVSNRIMKSKSEVYIDYD